VQPVSRQPPVVADARRIARSSAWAVGSPVASRSLAATARMSPPLATTAPTGTSPFSAASSAASRARRIMPMSVSEGSCVSDAGTKPMISVCPSLMPLQTEPGWDHTPGFASTPTIRARISPRTFRNARRPHLSPAPCKRSLLPPLPRSSTTKHRYRAVAPHSSQLRSSSRRPYLPRALILNLKVTFILQADSHSRSSVLKMLQIGLFYSAVWTGRLMLWGYRTVFCTAVDACPLAG
jgi:hypothetical protein